MAVFVCMLRGVNLGPHNRVGMAALRTLFESLGFHDVQTLIQSGNVVFRAGQRNEPRLVTLIEKAIEEHFGFRAEVLLRTAAELKDVIARNPFAARPDVDPGKLLVTFLESPTGVPAAWAGPEELHSSGREIYIYFPNGAGRSKLSWSTLADKAKTRGTARNWNTVRKLLEMAEKLEAA